MSHVVASKVFVTNLDDARVVGDELGFDLIENATKFAWYGKWVNDFSGSRAAVTAGYDPKTFGTCEHKLRMKDHQQGDYEIGLVRRVDGKPGWELVYDDYSSYGAKINKKAGKNLGRFKAKLGERVITRGAIAQKFGVQRSVMADGRIRVAASRMALQNRF